LPHPFGPTTTVMPPGKTSLCESAKDLNPCISSETRRIESVVCEDATEVLGESLVPQWTIHFISKRRPPNKSVLGNIVPLAPT